MRLGFKWDTNSVLLGETTVLSLTSIPSLRVFVALRHLLKLLRVDVHCWYIKLKLYV